MMVSERIRELRIDNDLSQTQVATLLNTSQTVYSRYERNERDLPINYLKTLSKFYNISSDYIIGLPDLPYPKR